MATRCRDCMYSSQCDTTACACVCGVGGITWMDIVGKGRGGGGRERERERDDIIFFFYRGYI